MKSRDPAVIAETIQCSQCVYCWPTEFICDAFPDGIPEHILNNEFIHTKPYHGDNGIQFEPIGGSDVRVG